MLSCETRLSPEQVLQYQNEGYTLPDGPVFEQEKFNRLGRLFEEHLTQWPADERPESMDTPHFGDARLNEWTLAPEVIDLVEPLLGPDIYLFSTHFICKPSGDGRRVPWHEDSAYWRKLVQPMNIATVWLAIDPSTEENGCMHVIPGSHKAGKAGFSDYEAVSKSENVFEAEIIPKHRRDELAVPCILEANHCSIHDARTQHASKANRSQQRRCGYTIRFMSADCRIAPEMVDHQLIYQARGKNLLNQRLADPNKNYPEVNEARRNLRMKAH